MDVVGHLYFWFVETSTWWYLALIIIGAAVLANNVLRNPTTHRCIYFHTTCTFPIQQKAILHHKIQLHPDDKWSSKNIAIGPANSERQSKTHINSRLDMEVMLWGGCTRWRLRRCSSILCVLLIAASIMVLAGKQES